MKIKNIGFWTREDKLYRNDYFDIKNNVVDLDQNIIQNWLAPFGEMCKSKGILIKNLNLVKDISNLDLLIVVDFEGFKNQSKLLKKAMKCKKKILMLEENASVMPRAWDLKTHKLFDYILTMNDDLIDNKKYFKYNFPSVSIHKNLYNLKKKLNFHDKKFSCMIAWNKVYKKKSTTNLKIEIIKWFEKNYPQSFDLFGPNWNEKVFSYQNSFTKYLNRNYFRFIRRILSTNYPSWKGNIKSHDKKVTINQYKFVFILENSSEYNGYITDKIFETFTSGSVPIYLGPKNITKYIPHNCFINFRDFKNLKELYSFLVSIDEKNYNNFINNIQIYLKSSNSKLFTTDQFNEDLFKVISFYN